MDSMGSRPVQMDSMGVTSWQDGFIGGHVLARWIHWGSRPGLMDSLGVMSWPDVLTGRHVLARYIHLGSRPGQMDSLGVTPWPVGFTEDQSYDHINSMRYTVYSRIESIQCGIYYPGQMD
jgi:hypothetical protein